jgi:GT2 family glycosyltransferase
VREEDTVVVVVVTYNSEALIPDLIASLPAGLGSVAWRLVVADNASSDATVEVTRRLMPEATIIEMGRNAGYAAGINAAAGVRPCGTLLVLNPDVRLLPGCVPELMEALQAPGVGIAVPRLEDGDGELILSMRREPTILRALADALVGARRAGRSPLFGEVVSDHRRYLAPCVTDWAEGSTLLISLPCWHRCAPWDESFFLYSEETDFALRARDAGFATRFVPTARAVHLEGASRIAPGLWSLLTLNRVRLYRRRHGLVPTSLFYLAVLLREGCRALLGHRTSRTAVRSMVSLPKWRVPPSPQAVESYAAKR